MIASVRIIAASATLGLALALSACATPPSDSAARADFDRTNDPFEPTNRKIFAANQVLDRYVIEPAAEVFRAVLPDPVRTGIRNVLNNLGEPVIITNNVLQGEFHRADVSLGRFVSNSTFGLGGLLDFASNHELPRQSGDFGQTLYRWGMPPGPYLILPILGPSNPRDAIGLGVDSYLDPFGYIAINNNAGEASPSRFVASGLDQRAQNIETLDELQKNSLDFYAQLRSLVRQRRAQELNHGEPVRPGEDDADLYIDPATPAAKP